MLLQEKMEPQKYLSLLLGAKRGRLIVTVMLLIPIMALILLQMGRASHHNKNPYFYEAQDYHGRYPPHPITISAKSSKITLFNPANFKQKIHLLIPVTAPNDLFCRTLYSGLINSYPPPELINYNRTFGNPAIARVKKIKGFRDYLATKTGDDDIVIMMDGFDVWFQLPLPIMLQRFFKMNKRVVWGADKKCWPNDPRSEACTLVPESPLPSDAYGPDTDRLTIYRELNAKQDNFRPRWLNSGTIVGYGKQLREVYETAWKKIENHPEFKSDQMIVADIFADAFKQGRNDMSVDFYSDLFQTMTYSHYDITFMRGPSPLNTATSFGSKGPDRKLDLEGLGIYDFRSEKGPETLKSPWFYRNLAYNRFTNSIPAVLHFNGPKDFMNNWWPLMWWSDEAVRVHSELTSEDSKWIAGSRYGKYWLPWEHLCGKYDMLKPPPPRPDGDRRWQ